MKASERWKRVRRVEMVDIGTGVTCSANTESCSVTIMIRRDAPLSDIGWESFQIEGTPEEMLALSDKLVRTAQQARELLARNKAAQNYDSQTDVKSTHDGDKP